MTSADRVPALTSEEEIAYLRDALRRSNDLAGTLQEELDTLRGIVREFQSTVDSIYPHVHRRPYEKLQGSTIPLDRLRLSSWAFHALRRSGIRTVGDVVQYSDRELLNIYNFGKKGLRDLRVSLDELTGVVMCEEGGKEDG